MRLNHDNYYLELLKLVAQRSTCGRRAVGAIFVDERGQILSTGYNGVPRGYPHCDTVPCDGRFDRPGDSSRCASVHAEVNVVLQCHRMDLVHTLYVSCTPCYTCSKMLCNTGLKRIVCLEPYADELGLKLLRAQGILLVIDNPLNS